MKKHLIILHGHLLLILGLLAACRPSVSPPQPPVQATTVPPDAAAPVSSQEASGAASSGASGAQSTSLPLSAAPSAEPGAAEIAVPSGDPSGSLPGSGPAYDPTVEARIGRVIGELIPAYTVAGETQLAAGAPMDLISRMSYYQTPGISIAVVNQGRLEWARGFGTTRSTAGDPVTPETLFQAASLSKPVSALGALLLVQEGQLELDGEINPKLTTWQIPGGQPVTLRQLLSHTAGFGVHGFPGYSLEAPLPSTLEILNGASPANSPAVRQANPPGSQYQYSGGGYMVLQQLMMDVTGQRYPELMKARVLDPLGMGASTFQQPILFEWSGQAASGHTYDSQPLPGGWNVYPEMAAAGLWSTPSDLARVLIEIDRAAHQENGLLLSRETAQAMLTPVQRTSGLGLVVPAGDRAAMFGHGGSNQGYRSLMFGVQGAGQGAVVIANSDNSMYLIFEIFRAIAREYGWPDVPQWRAIQREALAPVPANPAGYAGLTGEYQLGQLTFAIVEQAGRLWVQVPPGAPAYPLYPTGEKTFTTLDQAQFTFTVDANGEAPGEATSVTTNAWGETDRTASKILP